jgi:hypothetical protein
VKLVLPALLLSALYPVAPLHAEDPMVRPADAFGAELRAPLEIRDEQVLAQGRLTLPAITPEPVGRGVTRVRASFLWGNSFSWTQDVPGENPTDRRFLMDGETRTLDLTVTRGLSASTDVLVYRSAEENLQLTWLDRDGKILSILMIDY